MRIPGIVQHSATYSSLADYRANSPYASPGPPIAAGGFMREVD
jgi:hypothetical protein